MTDPQPPAKLDVFLSYKREEKDVAEGLANYLTTKGYDVWWDAALLAGEDFAKIVQEELGQSRAVVVLWSKQARNSHWVRAEAALALANGTLINAVIDGMAFEGIPPEFSNIHAVSLGPDVAKFHQDIAAAIAHKGTAPSQGLRTVVQAQAALDGKVKDADFFGAIAQTSDVENFRDYIARFGADAQFATIARRKIAQLEKAEVERRSFWRKARIGAVAATAVVGALASVVTILQYLEVNPTPVINPIVVDPQPELQPERRSSIDILRDVLRLSQSAKLSVVHDDQSISEVVSTSVKWATTADIVGTYYDGVIILASGTEVTVSINESVLNMDDVEIDLRVDPADPVLGGLAAITGASAGGIELAGRPMVQSAGYAYALDSPLGRSNGSFEGLATAANISLALSFENGDTGQLNVTKPSGDVELRALLFRDRKNSLDGTDLGTFVSTPTP